MNRTCIKLFECLGRNVLHAYVLCCKLRGARLTDESFFFKSLAIIGENVDIETFLYI